MLEEKGISPVLHAMPLPEGETAESGVVVKVDPQEGSWYTHRKEITLLRYTIMKKARIIKIVSSRYEVLDEMGNRLLCVAMGKLRKKQISCCRRFGYD